jgi:cyclopropane fatty-acyl-phospholipid synthase-like methyltransferase
MLKIRYHMEENCIMKKQWFKDQYPRSAKYDRQWMLENQIGPNVLWLSEALSEKMDLQPGMRVLDMGCGRAISSIFLAKEFGMQVWAIDLWIGANYNWQRIQAAGLENQVFPIHAEAHTLPFADAFFDAILSLDAYHYFGTDDLYLANEFAKYVKPGNQIGIVVPGLTEEFNTNIPEHLKPYWMPDYFSFHSPQWWSNHFEKSGVVDVELADSIPDGWEHWLRWLEIRLQGGFPYDEKEADMLREDAGRCLGFTRLIARRKSAITS